MTTYLDIAIFTLQRSPSNLKESHRHPRPNLGQFNALIPRPYKDVMPDLDTIFDILECHHSTPDFPLSLAWRKKMLQDLDDTLAEFSLEAVEDEMRITLGHSPARRPRDIMPENDVVQ